MKKVLALIFIALAVLTLHQDALALIGIGPRVGYHKTEDADKAQIFVGAAARFKLFGIGAEAAIDYRSEKYADGLVTVRSWPVQVSALYYPLPIIYGLAGAGWYHATMDYDEAKLGVAKMDNETTTTMGYHVGVGAELPLGGIKLTGDIRYVFLNYDFDEVPGMGDTKSDFYAVTVAVLWNF